MKTPIRMALIATLPLAGCGSVPMPDVTQLLEPEPVRTRATPPPGADPSKCYGQDATPAVIETVTEQVLMQPAQVSTDGLVYYPPVYKTETKQMIVEERNELWFETPCENEMTPEFIASLQRALKARGHYAGPVNGEMTGWTRRGIRSYQKPQGLDSAILSLAASRKLGLVTVLEPEAG